MNLSIIAKYDDFLQRTKNEPVVILQGSKRSGKTGAKLIDGGLKLMQHNGIKMQYFSESPKQQNFGLAYDFNKYFESIIGRFKYNGTQKTYSYKHNQLSFVNIPNNVRSNDIANSMGACDERYVNEVNMFSKSTFEKLLINNTGQMFVDYNPYREFWIKEYIKEDNFLKTTWRDNQFLSENQIALFLKWTEEGKQAEIGSYSYWRWQVMCEGNFAKLTGKTFTTENIHFDKKPEGLHTFIIFADPSNAKGGDYFALTLTAIGEDGKCYMVDSFSENMINKALIADQIKKWQRDHVVDRTFIETNGQYGLKFYNDCVLAGIPVDGWYSRQDKFERIMANFDVITENTIFVDTPQNREFAQQIYTFRNPDEKDEELGNDEIDFNDDNIDCLNNAILAYITVYGELKILF